MSGRFLRRFYLLHVFYLDQIQIFDWVIFANQKNAIKSDLLSGCGQTFFSQGNKRVHSSCCPSQNASIHVFWSCAAIKANNALFLGRLQDMCRPHTSYCCLWISSAKGFPLECCIGSSHSEPNRKKGGRQKKMPSKHTSVCVRWPCALKTGQCALISGLL